MYAGDGWAGEKVKGQTQDYTNTVQTERLRETLRKEMVRPKSSVPKSSVHCTSQDRSSPIDRVNRERVSQLADRRRRRQVRSARCVCVGSLVT